VVTKALVKPACRRHSLTTPVSLPLPPVPGWGKAYG